MRNMRNQTMRVFHAMRAVIAAMALAGVGGSAQAITLADLNAGGSLTTSDGLLTFQNFSVTTSDSLAGLDLSLIQVDALPGSGFGLRVLEFDAPLVAAGDEVGGMRIAFDVVASGALITDVGLRFTGTALGAGAMVRIQETVTSPDGSVSLEAVRIGGGAQNPVASASLPAGAAQISVVKNITLDTSSRLGQLAQLSEFEQSYTVAPVPEPGAFAIFGGSLALIVAASKRRWL